MNVGRFNTKYIRARAVMMINFAIRDAFVFDIHQFPYGARSRRKIQMNPDATRADWLQDSTTAFEWIKILVSMSRLIVALLYR